MSVRKSRLPISCEPCRVRKIRCPRDSVPCGTCVRRGVPTAHCQFARADDGSRLRPASQFRGDHGDGAVPSPPTTASSTSLLDTNDDDLAQRVQRLERLLQDSNRTVLDRIVPVDGTCASPSLRWSVPASSSRSPDRSAGHLEGSLRVSESGYVRFVPQYLDWNATLGLSDSSGSPPCSLWDVVHGARPGGATATAEFLDLVSALPSDTLCNELIHVYLTSFASLMHVLHDPSFKLQYEAFQADANSASLSWLALLFAVLATAVQALPPDSRVLFDLSRQKTIPDKMAELTNKYRRLAMRCLEADNYLWNHNITTLQALIILIYGMGHTHGQCWTLLGLACNLAMSIGCHVDPDAFNLTLIAKEERRRCWAVLMMLYTYQNTAMGRIGTSRSSFPSNNRDPADVDDEELSSGTLHRTGRATQMTYVLLKFRLYDLCTEICDLVLGRPYPDRHVVQSLDARIQFEQQNWEARYLQQIDAQDLPAHHDAHIKILNSYSGHLVLMLHQHAVSPTRPGPGVSQWSQERSLQNAKRVLDAHEEFETAPQLAPFRWFNRGLGSFYAFHAAVTLSVLMRTAASDAEASWLRDMLQSCVRRFERMRDLSSLCAKALPVLRYLLSHSRAPNDGASQSMPCHQHDSQQLNASPNMLARREQALTPFTSSSLPTDAEWDSLIDSFQPQQWLTPTNVPWEQWQQLVST